MTTSNRTARAVFARLPDEMMRKYRVMYLLD
jgi:hypothetical protein